MYPAQYANILSIKRYFVCQTERFLIPRVAQTVLYAMPTAP
jgi:hypothetical protein